MADDTPAQPTYSSKQVADQLGISGGMLRRYAMALEEVVGNKIDLHPRDGRRYDGEQVAVLMRAKQEVTNRRGLAVETAIRMVLGQDVPDTALLPPAALIPQGSDPEAVRTALEPLLTEVQALRRGDERALEVSEQALKVLKGIQAELAAAHADRQEVYKLRAEVEALRSEIAERPALPAPAVEAATGPSGGGGDGLLVRIARRLERIWRP